MLNKIDLLYLKNRYSTAAGIMPMERGQIESLIRVLALIFCAALKYYNTHTKKFSPAKFLGQIIGPLKAN